MTAATTASIAGFKVEGDKLVEADGAAFVMRGVNHMHVWFAQELSVSLRAIAATGANCVRIVLATGSPPARTVPRTRGSGTSSMRTAAGSASGSSGPTVAGS